MKNKLIIICGKSASGKDTLYNHLIGMLDAKKCVSMTTRPMRPSEENGREYYFIDKSEFLRGIDNNEFIEHRTYVTSVNGVADTWYYGLSKSNNGVDLDKADSVVVLDPYGAYSAIEYFGRDNCYLIGLDASYEVRTARAETRGGFDASEWDRRAIADDKDFSESKIFDEVDAFYDTEGCLDIDIAIGAYMDYLDYLIEEEETL